MKTTTKCTTKTSSSYKTPAPSSKKSSKSPKPTSTHKKPNGYNHHGHGKKTSTKKFSKPTVTHRPYYHG
jgi:hypothetical protein